MVDILNRWLFYWLVLFASNLVCHLSDLPSLVGVDIRFTVAGQKSWRECLGLLSNALLVDEATRLRIQEGAEELSAKQTTKKAGQVVLRLVWPGAAIKKTIEHTKNAKEQHKSNIAHIKGLFQEVRKNARYEPQEEAREDLSFEEAMSSRAPGSPSIPALYDLFLLKKRLALAVGAVFITMAIYALANGTWLGLATLLASPPVFFLIALSAQLRLWQLRTRRLSQAEKGGLQDFFTEIRGWWWVVLDPELSRKKGAQP